MGLVLEDKSVHSLFSVVEELVSNKINLNKSVSVLVGEELEQTFQEEDLNSIEVGLLVE